METDGFCQKQEKTYGKLVFLSQTIEKHKEKYKKYKQSIKKV